METQYRKLSPGKKESGGFRQKTRMHSLFPPFVTQEVKSVTKVKKKKILVILKKKVRTNEQQQIYNLTIFNLSI